MRRRPFARVVAGAILARLIGRPFGAVARGPHGNAKRKIFAVGPDIDGIVIRGRWRAHVALGQPSLAIRGTDAALGAVTIAHDKSTLTVSCGSQSLELRATLAHLRGLATSGSVLLALDVRSDAPLFLDLAGTGTVEATGSVPLLRVTTSGSVSADLTGLVAGQARVHARQASHIAIQALDKLTVVALDSARVSYRAGGRLQQTIRGAATVSRL